MKKIIKYFLILFLSFQFVAQYSATALGSGKSNSTVRAAHSTNAPINGGIVLLLIAGIGLGAKILIDRNRKKKSNLTTTF